MGIEQTPARDSLFELRSAEIVREVLARAGQSHVHVKVIQGGMERTGEIVATPATEGALEFVLFDVGLVSGAFTSLRFWLHDVAFLLDGTSCCLAGDRWSLTGRRLFSLDRRAAERLPLHESTAQLQWSHVVDGKRISGAAPVEDLGNHGIGLSVGSASAGIPDSATFPATLRIGGREIQCLAEPRHVKRLAGRTHYGIRLKTLLGRNDCTDAYLEQRFPQLVARRDLDSNHVYDLLQQSGYLALREGVAPPRDWFARQDDEAISRDVCFLDRAERLIGHVSFTRAYRRAWLGHQLATLRPHEEAIACRQAIYLHIAIYPTLVDGDDAMMVGYFDQGRPWHRRFFAGFANWVNAPELAVTFGLDRFERRVHEPAPRSAPGDVEVGAPRADELAGAAALVRAQLPPLIAEVLDIHPEYLTAPVLNPAYEGTRYHRGRVALVLRVRGGIAGVALCEVGSRELSIFNLFNMAQLFLLTGAQAPPCAAQLALLSAVREFYALRGEENPIIVAPPGTLRAEQEPGTFLAETMGMIAWSGRGLRQYENFIRYEFGKERGRDKVQNYATGAEQIV